MKIFEKNLHDPIFLLGAGRMAQGALWFLSRFYNAKIVLIDRNPKAIEHCLKLAQPPSNVKIDTKVLDLTKNGLKINGLRPAIIISCLPWSVTENIYSSVLDLEAPFVSITRPDYTKVDPISAEFKERGLLGVFGAGLEPGLVELLGKLALEKNPNAEELHLRCGGIPADPNNFLKYKRFFGDELPFELRPTYAVKNGELTEVDRFSGVEKFSLPEIKKLECWHDGLMPWVPSATPYNELKVITQKTIRYEGYSDAVLTLHGLGLLDQVTNDDFQKTPWEITQGLLKEQAEPSSSCSDLIIAQAISKSKDQVTNLTLVDRKDEQSGLLGMQRTTAFTACLTGSFILQDKIPNKGFLSLDQALDRKQIGDLFNQLRDFNIKIEEDHKDI